MDFSDFKKTSYLIWSISIPFDSIYPYFYCGEMQIKFTILMILNAQFIDIIYIHSVVQPSPHSISKSFYIVKLKLYP